MSQDLNGKCPSCGEVFLVAQLPMPLVKAAKLAARAACPRCGETKGITVAHVPSPPPVDHTFSPATPILDDLAMLGRVLVRCVQKGKEIRDKVVDYLLPNGLIGSPLLRDQPVKVKAIFAWYDFWVGAFYDRGKRRLYIFPVPCIGLVFEWRLP